MVHLQHRYLEALALPIERIDLIQVRVVEALVREVLAVAVKFNLAKTDNFSFVYIEKKVIVGDAVVMKEVDEEQVIMDPRACDEGVWKVLDWHGVVVDVQSFVDVELCPFYFFLSPGFCAKNTNEEDTVIHVGDSELIASRILLNFLQLDVVSIFAANFFLESKVVALE